MYKQSGEIDKAKTIWARDMGASQNAGIDPRYFKDAARLAHLSLMKILPRLVPYFVAARLHGRIVPQMLMWIEFGLVLLSTILAFCFPESRLSTGFVWWNGILRDWRGGGSISLNLLVGLAALFRAAQQFCRFSRFPQPHLSDEFSHLLLADTLLHGRLTSLRQQCGFILRRFTSSCTPLMLPCIRQPKD